MPNGKCRMHGGTNKGGKPGNKNALQHGIYSDAISSQEQGVWEKIPLDNLDDHIRIVSLQLVRAQRAQFKCDESEGGDLEVTEETTEAVKRQGGVPAIVKKNVKKERRDYSGAIQRLSGRLADLMLKRQMLQDKGGLFGITGVNVTMTAKEYKKARKEALSDDNC